VDAAVRRRKSAQELAEGEKKALELEARAEHAIGRRREILQKEARRMAEDG
jgi:hypothetical protein